MKAVIIEHRRLSAIELSMKKEVQVALIFHTSSIPGILANTKISGCSNQQILAT